MQAASLCYFMENLLRRKRLEEDLRPTILLHFLLRATFLHFLCLTCGNRATQFAELYSCKRQTSRFRALKRQNRYSADYAVPFLLPKSHRLKNSSLHHKCGIDPLTLSA